MGEITIAFTPIKETKGTWKFDEVLPTDLSIAKIGVLYVRKNALGELGWAVGQELTVTIKISG